MRHGWRAADAALAVWLATVTAALQSASAIAQVPQATTQTRPLSRPANTDLVRRRLLLAVDRLLADRWYPATAQPPMVTRSQDLADLAAALEDQQAVLRRVAVRSLGRFENPNNVPHLVPFLSDVDADVRREAANAIAQSVFNLRGDAVLPILRLFQNHVAGNPRSIDHGIAEAAARLHYEKENIEKFEEWIDTFIRAAPGVAPPPLASDAVIEAVVSISDRFRSRRLLPDSIRLLRDELRDPLYRKIRYNTFNGLKTSFDESDPRDVALILEAARQQCAPGPGWTLECGWELRTSALDLMHFRHPRFVEDIARALLDAAFQVRLKALRKYAAEIPQTKSCKELVEAIATDKNAIVQLEALSMLDPKCEDRTDILRVLNRLAPGIDSRATSWHVPTRAFEALARFDPEAAKPLLRRILGTDIWEIRAAAARAAGSLADSETAVQLADDSHPNVRTEAIEALVKMKSPALAETATRALASTDCQLVLTAANALRSTPNKIPPAVALLDALKRLTAKREDTSRDCRLAILKRLQEFVTKDASGLLPVGTYVEANDFVTYLKDFDPLVADAAADTIAILRGTRPTPTPTRREPEQPSEEELRTLPDCARIDMAEGGHFMINLSKDEAPLAVARFEKLADKHYFDGLTFHRMQPLFVIQGGSPGANEYSGASRFQRDEIGLQRHSAGAVGISTRGRDTGDAQIFVDLIALPSLDYQYTVMGHVGSRQPADILDRILEGAKISRVTVQERCAR